MFPGLAEDRILFAVRCETYMGGCTGSGGVNPFGSGDNIHDEARKGGKGSEGGAGTGGGAGSKALNASGDDQCELESDFFVVNDGLFGAPANADRRLEEESIFLLNACDTNVHTSMHYVLPHSPSNAFVTSPVSIKSPKGSLAPVKVYGEVGLCFRFGFSRSLHMVVGISGVFSLISQVTFGEARECLFLSSLQ